VKLFLEKRDWAVVGTAAAGQAAAGCALVGLLGPEWGLAVASGLGVGAILAGGHYTLRRERALDIFLHDPARNYRQLEALFGLYASVDLRIPLPAMRHFVISPDALAALVREVVRCDARTIVECGSGTSTVVLAKALAGRGGGHVFALEAEAEFAEKTRELLRLHGVEELATVLTAPLEPLELEGRTFPWYAAEAVARLPERIDLLFVDGPRGELGTLPRYPALPVLGPRLTERAPIIVDDYLREDERVAVRRWRATLPGYALEELPLEKGFAVLRPGRPRPSAADA
jgi:predicted O-methyltransferase YrrM